MISALEPLGPSRELARAYASRSRRAMLDRQPDAVAVGRKAMSIAEEVGDTESWVRAAISVGTAMRDLDDAGALALLREAAAVADRNELVLLEGIALNNIIVTLGAGPGTFDEFDRAIADFQSHSARYGLHGSTVGNWRVLPLVRDGDWDGALAAIEEERDESIYSASRDLQEAVMRTAREGPAVGLPLIDGPRARLLATAEPQSLAGASWSALAHFLAGDMPAAIERAESLATVFGALPEGPRPIVAATLLAALRQRDEGAVKHWAAVVTAIPRKPLAQDSAAPHRELAVAARARIGGNTSDVIDHLASAAALFEQSRNPLAGSLARLERARILVEAGRRDEAAAEVEAGLKFWRKAKATWFIGEVEKWASAAGVRAATAT